MANSDETDDKKSYTSKLTTYIIIIVIVLFSIPVYYGFSGLILYACKVAQSSVLPDDKKCYPYVNTKPEIDPIVTNIFTTNTDPQMSMKLKIPYDDYNSSNSILDSLRSYKNNPDSYFLLNYFVTILESTLQFNYSIFSYLLNKLNLLPESLLVLTGPIIFSILSPIIIFIDIIHFIYLWFTEMGWFFKENTNEAGKGLPKWENISLFSAPFRYMIAFGLIILFTLATIFGFAFSSLYIFFAFWFCVISVIAFKSELNGVPASGFTIIKETYKHYKVQMMGLLSFFVILFAFTQLGAVGGIVPTILVLLIYFGLIAIDIYTPVTEKGLSLLTSYKQAKKTCISEPVLPKDKHGLLYHWLFGGPQSGGNIKNELRSIGKKLSGK